MTYLIRFTILAGGTLSGRIGGEPYGSPAWNSRAAPSKEKKEAGLSFGQASPIGKVMLQPRNLPAQVAS